MVALVSAETVLLVLLVVLVAGLLRSHAEILRRLGPAALESETASTAASAPTAARLTPAGPRLRREGNVPAAPIAGPTPSGDSISLDFQGGAAGPTLLAFLTTGCTTCAGFWATLGEPRLPPGVQTVIVTRGAERERPARLRSLAPSGVAVLMSSEAWEKYAVPGAPYFVLVDRVVRGEGVATTWQALASLVSDAIEDQHESLRSTGTTRGERIDETLAAAGIGIDHPSLYPAGRVPRPPAGPSASR